jgi:hypothetical protein
MTILSAHDRTALADAQAALAAVAGKGDTRVERDLTAARDELVQEIHERYEGRRGLVTEMARALRWTDPEKGERHVHRTTVHRIFTAAHTGRHAYRSGPVRKRTAAGA